MGLKEYKAKRKFDKTPEPEGKVNRESGKLKFVIQKHHASHLHYDFRLELEGVLKSWAIPKGPSMNPADKRLAMMVEDHPIEYGKFEGIIPKGNYGAGTVMIWDEGTYHPVKSSGKEMDEKELIKGLYAGNLKFVMHGQKVNGEFALVKLKKDKGNEWLLIKKKDVFESTEDVTQKDRSVVSGRTLDEIKDQSGKGSSVWYSKQQGAEVALPDGAKKADMPHEVKPMMATLVDQAFDSKDWIYEIKWDGFRALAEVNYNEVHIYSRNNLSFNDHFPDVVDSLSKLASRVVLDGEICAVDENGKASFQLIQNFRRTGKGNIMYYVFDILYYDGYDLTDVPLIERKFFLNKILPDLPHVKYSDHVEGEGVDFFEIVRAKGLEGVMAKKAQSKYYTGTRGKEWLKIKVQSEQEAVIAGYTEPRGGRKHFGSLVLGIYERGELVYIGHTGGGFDYKTLRDTNSKLEPLKMNKSPFKKTPKTNTPVTWVKPELVCEVKFQEWTDDGIMRQPIFIGLREDKNAKEVIREFEKSTDKVVNDETPKRITKTKTKTKDSNDKSKAKDKKSNRVGSGRAGTEVKNRRPVAKRESVSGSKSKKKPGSSKRRVKEEVKRNLREGKAIDGRGETVRKPKAARKKSVAKSNRLININMNGSDAQIKVDNIILPLSNLKKLYWPEEDYTKQDLIEYYDKIADYLLPYLKDRPENLRRNPHGYAKESFFQKDMPATIPDWIETKKIYSESVDKEINYMICQNKASLLYMANLGCIEINPWLSRIQYLDFPDYIVIDLDPQDVPFELVIEVTLAVKEVLDRGKIKGFCKTSGSRGMHIYIPMGAKYNYDQAKDFAQLIASLTHALVPAITSLERKPDKRKNKIYLDYLQNRRGQTLAAPYCVRPKQGATVSTPLEWDEVKHGLHPSQFTIKTIFSRIREKGDLFKGIMSKGVDMKKALEALR